MPALLPINPHELVHLHFKEIWSLSAFICTWTQHFQEEKKYTVERVLFTWETHLADSHRLMTGKEPYKDLPPIMSNCTAFQKKIFSSLWDLPFVQVSVKDGFQHYDDRFGIHSIIYMSNKIMQTFFTFHTIIHKTQEHQ